MVQNVECIYADLPVQVLGDPGILRKRDIDIGKAGTDGHVPPQVSELVANSAAAAYVSGHAAVENPGILQVSHVRGVPVGCWRKSRLNRACYAGPQRRRPCERSIAGVEVHWIATLQGHDCRKLPALHQAVATEGQFVDTAQNEAVSRIEVRQTTVATQVVAILYSQSLGGPGIVVN